MGPRADEIRLADNMVGDAIVPQTKMIPQVDLVITHGGNNTTTESAALRQADDRAAAVLGPVRQRPAGDELGYGVRLATYDFTDDELLGAVDRLLADPEMRARAASTGEAVRARDGLRVGADVIERVGLEHLRGRG